MLPVRPRTRNRELARGGPFSLFNDFEHMLDHAWNWARPVGLYGGYDVDIWSDADHIYLEAEMPGLTKDDVEISVESGVLSIKGQKSREEIKEDHTHHLEERYYGSFNRSFTLPSTVDPEKVQATLKNGVLRVVLDKREEVKAKRIEVKGQ